MTLSIVRPRTPDLSGERKTSIRNLWLGHEPHVFDGPIVTPEVVAADVTEPEPNSWMHGVVINRVNSGAPGTGNGKPWKFIRVRIEEWLKRR